MAITRKSTLLLVVAAVLLVIVGGHAYQGPKALLKQGHKHFTLAKQQKSQKHLEAAIKTYKKALDTETINFDQRKEALNRLSKAFYLLADCFLKPEGEQKQAYTKGRRYGILSLIMNFQFRMAYGDDPEEELAEEDLKPIEEMDAFYWAVSNVIRLDEFKGIIKQQARIPFYKAAYDKMLAIDEAYAGGGPHRSLGALHCKVHFKPVVGGLIAKAHGLDGALGKKHLLKAINIAPHYLENKLFYAKYWAQVKDKELCRKLLQEVIAAPKETVDKYPLTNWSVQKKAQALLNKLS